jgi:alkylation response protein AidB-like acyl-CoA dehydrogenase
MDLGFSEFQQKTRDTAREFLAEKCPKSLLRELETSATGHSPELWREIAELGWVALGVPEEYGGLGGGLVDQAVIVEEMGYAAYMSPFTETAVLAACVIARAGSAVQKRRLLPRIADGSLLLATAIAEESGEWTASSVAMNIAKVGGAHVLAGEKRFVDFATATDSLIVFARAPGTSGEDGVSAVLIDTNGPSIECTDLRATAGKQHAVLFRDVQVAPENLIVAPGGGGALLRGVVEVSAAMNCAYMVGLARRALDMTVNHAQTRTQFGQPLGKFQAVQHHCANMAMLTEGARLLTYEALWRLDSELPATKEVAMAKAFTNDATRETLWLAHQIHGGIGVMREYDLHFYFRQAKSLELTLGGTRDFLEIVADELALTPR